MLALYSITPAASIIVRRLLAGRSIISDAGSPRSSDHVQYGSPRGAVLGLPSTGPGDHRRQHTRCVVSLHLRRILGVRLKVGVVDRTRISDTISNREACGVLVLRWPLTGPEDHRSGDHRPSWHRPSWHRLRDHWPRHHMPGDHRPTRCVVCLHELRVLVLRLDVGHVDRARNSATVTVAKREVCGALVLGLPLTGSGDHGLMRCMLGWKEVSPTRYVLC